MHFPIATYGRSDWGAWVGLSVVLAGGACGAAAVGDRPELLWLALPWIVPVAFFTWFFRDPDRTIPDEPGALISPADGVVSDVGVVREDGYLQGDALRIGIFLSPLDVHVNRMPCDATVRYRHHQSGAYGPAYSPDAAIRNESCSVGIESREPATLGLRLVVRQVVGAVARRIVCPVELGDEIARGERYGMIKLGSRTELWVPVEAGFTSAVAVGDRVRGGSTVLGRVPVATGGESETRAAAAAAV